VDCLLDMGKAGDLAVVLQQMADKVQRRQGEARSMTPGDPAQGLHAMAVACAAGGQRCGWLGAMAVCCWCCWCVKHRGQRCITGSTQHRHEGRCGCKREWTAVPGRVCGKLGWALLSLDVPHVCMHHLAHWLVSSQSSQPDCCQLGAAGGGYRRQELVAGPLGGPLRRLAAFLDDAGMRSSPLTGSFLQVGGWGLGWLGWTWQSDATAAMQCRGRLDLALQCTCHHARMPCLTRAKHMLQLHCHPSSPAPLAVHWQSTDSPLAVH
jgi:hypothetical protein